MITVSVPRVQTSDKDVNQLQTNVINALQPIGQALNNLTTQVGANPQNSGAVYTVSLIKGNTKVRHTLGKVPTGWSIVDVNALVTIYRAAWDVNYLTLVSSGVCKVSVFIFLKEI